MQAAAPARMRWIPGGSFRMGAELAYPAEAPVREVSGDGFWIDAFAVTNVDFAAFVAHTGYMTRAEREPDPAAYPGAQPQLLQSGGAAAADDRQRHLPHRLPVRHSWVGR